MCRPCVSLTVGHVTYSFRARQHAFRDVQALLGEQSCGPRSSKAQVLQGAVEHIGQLEAESSGLVEEVAQLKGEISALKLSVRHVDGAVCGTRAQETTNTSKPMELTPHLSTTRSQMQSSQPTLEANARQLYKAYMHKYAGHDIKFWIVCAPPRRASNLPVAIALKLPLHLRLFSAPIQSGLSVARPFCFLKAPEPHPIHSRLSLVSISSDSSHFFQFSRFIQQFARQIDDLFEPFLEVCCVL